MEDPIRLTLIVVDDQQTRLAADIDDWNAATVLACASEDPVDWPDLGLVWPRYRTAVAVEFADSLPLTMVDFDTAVAALSDDRPWMLIDLSAKRVFSGSEYDEIPRDACYGTGERGGEGPVVRIPLHLPPWWEVHNDARPDDVRRPRTTEIRIPDCRRDVLWGAPLTRGLARLMVDAARGDSWDPERMAADRETRYRLTIQVHRDWLMTPRDDLDGRPPRQCLHGGMHWIDRIVDGQQWLITQGCRPVPIPRSFSDRDKAPMGREEICIYFDLCRELIDVGWDWLIRQRERTSREDCAAALADVLEQARERWMHAPHEGDSPPVAIVRAERRRIPRIQGGDGENHVIDCNCPICDALADGMFGPAFVSIDGHHLELDDEFAFSLCETREEWEEQQREYRQFEEEMDAKRADRERAAAQGDEPASDESDELAPVWPRSSPDGIPGDRQGHMQLAFHLADMIGTLEGQGDCQADIDSLNRSFREYRRADADGRSAARERFKDALEQAARRHDSLVTRAADLQSKLDELARVEAQRETDLGDTR